MKNVNTELYAKALSESADGSGLLLRAVARMSEAYTELLGICDERDRALQEALVFLHKSSVFIQHIVTQAGISTDIPLKDLPLYQDIQQFIHRYSTTDVGMPPTNS